MKLKSIAETTRKTAAQSVRTFMATHPLERECVCRGIVNYSAMARELRRIHPSISIQAFVIALRRFRKKQVMSAKSSFNVQTLIEQARFGLETKISLIVLDKPKSFDTLYALQTDIRRQRGVCNIIEGNSVATVVHSSRFSDRIDLLMKRQVKRKVTDLCQLVVDFDEEFETTPGVVAHIYSILAFHGINVREEMSCATELLLVLAAGDGPKAMAILQGDDS